MTNGIEVSRVSRHMDLRTGERYYTYTPLSERPTVTDMRTGRPHGRPGRATAAAIYGASLRLERR